MGGWVGGGGLTGLNVTFKIDLEMKTKRCKAYGLTLGVSALQILLHSAKSATRAIHGQRTDVVVNDQSQ